MKKTFALAIALFVVAPYFAANLIASYVRSAALLSVFEGIIRILIFVGYILHRGTKRLDCFVQVRILCVFMNQQIHRP